jgi:predicted DNA-binding WGR domain protein
MTIIVRTLNFTDLTGSQTGCVTLGSNKFWKGSVVDHGDGTGDFECRWGAVGESGNDKGSVRGISVEEAKRILNKKVAEKLKKGYTEVETRSDSEELQKAASKGIAVSAVAPSRSSFHPDVSALLATFYGESGKAVQRGLAATAGATDANPIGNLSDRQLAVGGAILNEIAEYLLKEQGMETPDNRTTPVGLLGTKPDKRIIDLTNRYMSNIPREIRRDQRGADNLHRLVINSYLRLQEQRDFLQLLRDAHLSQDVFKAASTAVGSDKDQIWYDGLQCTIEALSPNEADFLRVVKIFTTNQSRKNANWWFNYQPAVQVKRVFRFTRNGTEKSYLDYARKVTAKPGAVGEIMAWHGTRTENLLGIGKSGLLMPENLPVGVVISGKAFGQGIYHAPAWPATNHTQIGSYPIDGTNGAFKSLNYTSLQGAYYGSGNSSRTGYMFLQDVALGIPEVRTSACKNQYRPKGWPQADFIFACGARSQDAYVHDELVTFDQNAQRFRYLIEVGFVK